MDQNLAVEFRGEGSGGDIVCRPTPFDSLPEECISIIVSFTSPRAACVVASVSKTCESAVKSDVVWEKFLPSDYSSMVPRYRDYSSKKEIYFDLCYNHVLIEHGKKSLWLDKASGKNCIMLSAMNLSIKWGDDTRYWQWIQIPESRYENVAKLESVCRFVIRGRTKTSLLSPRTRYSVYIVFKKTSRFYGFKDVAVVAAVGVVGRIAYGRFIFFDAFTDKEFVGVEKPKEREDGWMEVKLGDFFNEGGLLKRNEIEMSVSETQPYLRKSGLIIQGIEIRPTKIK